MGPMDVVSAQCCGPSVAEVGAMLTRSFCAEKAEHEHAACNQVFCCDLIFHYFAPEGADVGSSGWEPRVTKLKCAAAPDGADLSRSRNEPAALG